MDIALVLPKSDRVRVPGYTISKYGTEIMVSRASLSADGLGTRSLPHVGEH